MFWEIVWRGVAMGIGGTVFMDIWAIILHRAFQQPAPNWGPVGRWFWHLRKGTVFHDNIAKAAHYEHEVALGWISHYAVGIIYGVLLAVIVPAGWFATPTFLLPWIVGIVTVGARLVFCSSLALASAGQRRRHQTRTRYVP